LLRRTEKLTRIAGWGERVGYVAVLLLVGMHHRRPPGLRSIRSALWIHAVPRSGFSISIVLSGIACANTGAVPVTLKHVIRVGSRRAIVVESIVTSKRKSSTRANDWCFGAAIDIIRISRCLFIGGWERCDLVVVEFVPGGCPATGSGGAFAVVPCSSRAEH